MQVKNLFYLSAATVLSLQGIGCNNAGGNKEKAVMMH